MTSGSTNQSGKLRILDDELQFFSEILEIFRVRHNQHASSSLKVRLEDTILLRYLARGNQAYASCQYFAWDGWPVKANREISLEKSYGSASPQETRDSPMREKR